MNGSKKSLLILDLHPEFHIGGSGRVFRGLCRFANPLLTVGWFGASYEFFNFLDVVYRFLGLPTAKLVEVDDTLSGVRVERFTFVSLIIGTRAWVRARRIVHDATGIYAKNEIYGLLCILFFGGARALRKTTVAVHTALAMPNELRGTWRFVHDRVYRNPIYRYLLNHARAIHGCSSSVYLDMDYVGVKRSRVSYIGWPVWIPEAPSPARPEAFTVAFAARFTQQKGVEYLVDVAGRLAGEPIEIQVAGGGPLADQVTDAARRFPRFKHIGVLPSVGPLFARSCAVLIPSRWEGIGTVCAEAFFAGLPAVAFDIAGNLDIFETAQQPELMVPHFDVEKLADKIRMLEREWRASPAEYFKKYERAGERVRARYEAKRVFSDTLSDMGLSDGARFGSCDV